MTKHLRTTILFITLVAAGSNMTLLIDSAHAHCQIPCGIYDDYARIQSMLEDVTTIEKSIQLINKLSKKADAQSQNQLVRWVMNKEKHAQNIINNMSNYFLTQRIQSKQKDYTERLIRHHAVMTAAMKTKQNVDQRYAKALRKNINALRSYYPEHKH